MPKNNSNLPAKCRFQSVDCLSSSSSLPTLPRLREAPSAPPMMLVMEQLFKIKPLFEMARRSARAKIQNRGVEIGLDWDGTMEQLKSIEWDSRIIQATNNLKYPDYYMKPFHAYPKGNLSLDAALEVELAAKSVHATVMDPASKQVLADGDAQLRSSYQSAQKALWQEVGGRKVEHVVDLGCSTGLSSVALAGSWGEGVSVSGVDMSQYFVAVGQWMMEQDDALASRITISHGAAESTTLPSSSADLVSMCLVCHELPFTATQAIFQEAYRLLRPGGCLSIMEMDPEQPAWQRVLKNPAAFAAFKSTEPWLGEYVRLDMQGLMMDSGFEDVRQKAVSPKHKAVLGVKR